LELDELAISPAQVAELQQLLQAGTINDTIARQVIDAVLAGEGDPAQLVQTRQLAMVSDDNALAAAVERAIAQNADAAQKIRDGKAQAIGALIGAVMRETKGKADAAKVRELIMARLG
jgi:aspartyl-tRNA(Asn)/glutamyl-tRNA(Gln) amidotransferase subunit B